MRKLFQEQAGQVRTKPRAKPTASAPRAKPLRRLTSQAALPNYLDPMCKAPMPASLSDGKALAHTSLVSKDFSLAKHETTGTMPGPVILLATNTGMGSTVGRLIHTEYTGVTATGAGSHDYKEVISKNVMFNIPTLSGPDVGGHPTAGRAMKFGVTVINNTNALKRGGRVTYMNTLQRLPDVFTGGTAESPTYYWDSVIEAVKSAPDRRRINGDNLVEPKQSIGAIVDNIKYHTFNRWTGTDTYIHDNTYFTYTQYLIYIQ